MYYTSQLRRGGRAVECTSLENWQRLIAFLGFKSLSLRHFLHTGIIPSLGVENIRSNSNCYYFPNSIKSNSNQLSIIENTKNNHAIKEITANHSSLTIFLYILFNDAR
jgi:hypothetical protein